MAVRYGTFRICVLRTSHLEPYRTSVPYFSSIFEAYRSLLTYRTRTITKKAFCTSVTCFLAKIEAYRTSVPYRTAILAFNNSQLLLTLKSLAYINQRSQFTHLASVSAVFCLGMQKTCAMYKKSGVFTKRAYQRTDPYFYKKGVSYLRTVLLSKN